MVETNRVDINNVLNQMRQVRAQMDQRVAQPNEQDVAPSKEIISDPGRMNHVAPTEESTPTFGEMFKSAIDTVNHHQKAANELAQRYEQGDPKVDLPEVMIALQKSSISFQAMTQVRNKMLEAYKEIMNMPL